MKKSDVQPNTIYRVRATRHGTTPIGFDKFVLTGDEIVAVTSDNYHRDQSTKRYVEVHSVWWHWGDDKFVADTDTKQIAFKDIDGDWNDLGTLDDITAEQRDRLTEDKQRQVKRHAQREVNKTRWAALDTATLDLINVGEYDRPGAVSEYSDTGLTGGIANDGAGTIKVTLTLDAIEAIDALIVWARLSREVSA